MSVRAVVVEHHVGDLASWHRRLDGAEEAQELLVTVTLQTASWCRDKHRRGCR